MEKQNYSTPIFIFIRYIILLCLVLSLAVIYKILTPITLFSTAGLLGFIYETATLNDFIIINKSIVIQIIPACVAGSAYLLLLILNLSTQMNIKKRIYSIVFSVIMLFVINIIRIFILSMLLINEFRFFDLTHKVLWYGLSIVFVVGIWFLTAYLFKVKDIPVYSDFKYFIKGIAKKTLKK